MVCSRRQPLSAPAGVDLVSYDGVCGLCSRLLHFLLRHDHRRVFSFAPLHGNLGQSIVEHSGGNPGELSSFYVVADGRTAASRLFTRSNAALFAAGELGWPWKAARWMRSVPREIRDWAYDVVARNRYRRFGRCDRCPIPNPELESRCIDSQ